MTLVNIPVAAHKGFKALVKLSSEQLASLKAFLKSAKPSLSRFQFTDSLDKAIAEKIPDFHTVINELFNIEDFRFENELDPDKAAEFVSSSLRDNPHPEYSFTEEERELLQARLSDILSDGESISISNKAQQLQVQHDKVYRSSNVYTDLRPVFSSSPDSIKAIVAIHTLKIRFTRNTGEEEFYVAMDDADLDELIKALERAKAKGAIVNMLSEKCGVLHLNSQ
jgi:hypothetical protein